MIQRKDLWSGGILARGDCEDLIEKKKSEVWEVFARSSGDHRVHLEIDGW